MVIEATFQMFYTESRMRENCTYGSMRGIRRKTAKSVLRVVEDRAGVPSGGVPLYSTPHCIRTKWIVVLSMVFEAKNNVEGLY